MYEKKSLFALCLASFANAYSTTYIFSFVGFLAVDISDLKDTNESGYLAGFISSSMFFGRVLSSAAWGYLADKKGRKPTLIASLISITVFSFLFGFTSTVFQAIFFRFMLGFLNGSVLTLKTVAPEITTHEHRAMAMAWYGACWGLGIILGPSISGWLVQSESDLQANSNSSLTQKVELSSTQIINKYFSASLVSAILETKDKNFSDLFLTDRSATAKTDEKVEFLQTPEEETLVKTTEKQRFWTYKFCIVLLVYCMLSFATLFVNEVIPLWSVSSLDAGGLGFSSKQTGALIGIGGIFQILTNIFLFPKVTNILSFTTTLSLASLGYAFFLLLLINIPSLFSTASYLTVILYSTNGIRIIFDAFCYSSIFNLTNYSSPRCFRARGNVASMLFASIAKMLGPAIGSYLFAYSLEHNESIFLNWKLCFYVGSLIMLLVCVLSSLLIPKSTNQELE
eukprot:snap_masked-scaffold_14-processed-gene-6.35-mRNA-1 protein AED:0.40 eAED:0.40 QI:0/0/0/0.5/1/1/2/0/453